MKYLFSTEIPVRDYECDIQGIVNNANYQHYTEHTRHLFLKEKNLSFAALHEQGIDVVVARMTLSFKEPFRPDDVIVSCLNCERFGVKYEFTHHLYRKNDMKLCHTSKVTCVCIIDGKLSTSEIIDKALLAD